MSRKFFGTVAPTSKSGYVLEDVLAIIKLRTGTLEIFPEDDWLGP